MTRRLALLNFVWLFGAVITLCGPAICAGDEPEVHLDGAGDAVIRRTDLNNDGPIDPASNLPDLDRIVIGGWLSPSPRNDRYTGEWREPRDVDLFRVDVVFAGLVNPPGPLNLRGEGYDPYKYGQNPVYGYIEFDIDSEQSTGGEIDGVRNRPLGNASRFGGRLSGSAGEEAAVTGFDFDDDLCTGPQVERSGEEAHLSLCGCQPISVEPQNDPTPGTFDPGDTWLLFGRLFRRTHAFVDYSAVFGGSEPGQYDPIVELRISHDLNRDETTISLVYPLTMRGAALLTGQQQQSIDLNAGNHTSLIEMLTEIRIAALGGGGGACSDFDLLRGWADSNHDELDEYLRVDHWDVLSLVGMPYSIEQSDALYVWTDVGPKFEHGDCNGDSLINAADQDIVMISIAQSDGTAFDADGRVNGQTLIVDFAENFALFDLNYDGYINSIDLERIGYVKQGDVNSDRLVNQTDLSLLESMLGVSRGNPLFNPAADLNDDDQIDATDRRILERLLSIRGVGDPTMKTPLRVWRTGG